MAIRWRALALLLLAASWLSAGGAAADAGYPSITTLDTGGYPGANVGSVSSLQLDASGNPVVAYHEWGEPGGRTRVAHCNDPNCDGGDESIVLLSDQHAAGRAPLQLDATGHPVLVSEEYDFSAANPWLNVVHCNDANCAGDNESTTSVGYSTRAVNPAIVLDADGYPVISYFSQTGLGRNLLHCDDPNCAGEIAGNEGGAAGVFASGYGGSVALDAAGNPVESFYSVDSSSHLRDLQIRHCGNPACTSGGSFTSPASAQPGYDASATTSLTLDSAGNPVVLFFGNNTWNVLRCNDPNCEGGDESIVSPVPGSLNSGAGSMVLDAADHPAFSFRGDDGLAVVHCGNPTCAGGALVARPDSDADAGYNSSLHLDAAGRPVISYYTRTGNGDLKLLHCADPGCLGPVGGTTSLTGISGAPGRGSWLSWGVLALLGVAAAAAGARASSRLRRPTR